MQYEKLSPTTLSAAKALMDSGDKIGFARALVALSLHQERPSEVLPLIHLAAVDPDPGVRGNALLSVAHMSRRFMATDEATIRPIVERGLRDPDRYVAGHAHEAVDDLSHFEGWTFD